MKKVSMAIAFISIFTSSIAIAGSCEIPQFVKIGIKLKTDSSQGQVFTVAEIDKKACWVQAEKDGTWINLNATKIAMPVE